MDVERIIGEIEQLQEMFEAPDIEPLSASDIFAANRRHDETLAHSPWFRLWQRYGVCCRSEAPVKVMVGGIIRGSFGIPLKGNLSFVHLSLSSFHIFNR